MYLLGNQKSIWFTLQHSVIGGNVSWFMCSLYLDASQWQLLTYHRSPCWAPWIFKAIHRIISTSQNHNFLYSWLVSVSSCCPEYLPFYNLTLILIITNHKSAVKRCYLLHMIYFSVSLEPVGFAKISVSCVVLRTLLRKTIRLDPPAPVVFSMVDPALSGHCAVRFPGTMIYLVTALRW